jgi:tetratricopeptide (TPR) repeat protein
MKRFFLALCLLFSLFVQAQGESADQRISRYTLEISKHPDSAGHYVNRCKAYIEKEAFAAAEADCNKALQLDPKNGEALKWRGAARYLQNNLDSSILDFNQVLKDNPQDAQVWRWRGNSWYWLNKLDKAIADFTEALRLNSKSAITWFNRGEAYYWSEKYSEAVGDLSESLTHDPKYGKAWYTRGLCYFYLGKFDLANADLTQALALDPQNADILAWRGRSHFSNSKDDLALADLTEALRLNPNHSFAWMYRGDLYRATEKHELAITDYTQALLIDQKNSDALNKRGLSYYALRRYEEAIADFNAVLIQTPQSAEALSYRGDAYKDLGKWDLALKDYTEGLRLQPKNAELIASRGIVYKRLNKPDLALKDLNEAITLQPASVFALTHRGDLYMHLSKWEDAANDYNAALALDPKNFSARNNRGNLFYNQGKHDLAISDYSMILLQNPKLTMALINRGYAYRFQKKYDLAIADLTQALSLEPTSVEALSKRGTVYMDGAKWDSALLDFNKALRLDPTDTTVLNHRGLVYLNQNKYELAIRDFNEALRIKPKMTAVLNNLALVYYRQGNYDAAIGNFTKALKIDPENTRLIINLILVNLAADKLEAATALYKQYRQKAQRSYIDEFTPFSFLKNYITACCEYLINKDYAKALPLLQASLEEYNEANQNRTDIPISQEYANVLVKTAWVQEQLGNKEKALEYYTKATVVNPGLAEVTARMDQVKSKMRSDQSADKTPPALQLLTPSVVQGTTVEIEGTGKNALFVSGMAKDESGIAWVKINGADAGTLKEDGYFAATIKAAGDAFTVQSANKAGLVASATYGVKVKNSAVTGGLDIQPIPPDEKPAFHAVLIACSNYDGGKWSKLPTTISEAQAYKKVLTTQYGFDPANIVELYDKGYVEILSALSSKLEAMTDKDNLVILFAGHGTYRKAGTELIGYWVPLHANVPEIDYISNKKLDELISGCNAKHILMLSDACYGAAMRGGDEENALPQKMEYIYKSRQMLTSGGLEKVPGESVFINMVMKTLELNQEKYLSAKLLYNLIFSGVRNQTDKEPELNIFGKDGNQGGQFYFIRSK